MEIYHYYLSKVRLIMKKIIFISVCCILCLSGCSNKPKVNFDKSNEKQLEKEIAVNFNKIEEVTDMTSSNPYDYTKNEYYMNIVELGENAVSVLQNMYENKELSGVNAYLSALAIQDITKCNLYEKYDLDWQTAEKFYTLWKDHSCASQ